MSAVVTAVSLSAEHGPLKLNQASVRLLEGRGVEGDAHLARRPSAARGSGATPGSPNGDTIRVELPAPLA